jgi:transcriptional regulator with XRE-family HTH domain
MRQQRITVNGGAIRALRDALGWNLVQFSEAVGVHNSYMSRVENGLRQPSFEVRRRIAATLGVPVGVITREVIPESTELPQAA